VGWVEKYREWDSFGVSKSEENLDLVNERLKDDPLIAVCRAECLLVILLETLQKAGETVQNRRKIDFLDSVGWKSYFRKDRSQFGLYELGRCMCLRMASELEVCASCCKPSSHKETRSSVTSHPTETMRCEGSLSRMSKPLPKDNGEGRHVIVFVTPHPFGHCILPRATDPSSR